MSERATRHGDARCFKVSEGEGSSGKGGLGKEDVYPCPPASAPSRLGPRPRLLHSERTAAGKTTRDRSLTRQPPQLQLPARWRGAANSSLKEVCKGGGCHPERRGHLQPYLDPRSIFGPGDQREEAGPSGHPGSKEESTNAQRGRRRPGGAAKRVVSEPIQAGAPQPRLYSLEGARGDWRERSTITWGDAKEGSWHCLEKICLFIWEMGAR